MLPSSECEADEACTVVAYKRFGDNVPNQINTSFIGGIKSDLDGALTSMVLDVSDEDCRKWFE